MKLHEMLDKTTRFMSSPVVPHIRNHYLKINESLSRSGSTYLYCSMCVRLTKNRGRCCMCAIDCCDNCGFRNAEFYACGLCVTECPKCKRIVRQIDTQLFTTNNDDYDVCNDCFPKIKKALMNNDKFMCFNLDKN